MALGPESRAKLRSFFARYGYHAGPEDQWSIDFESGDRRMRFVYDPRAYDYELFVSDPEDGWVGLSNRELLEFFDSDLGIRRDSEESFVESVLDVLEGPCEQLLLEPTGAVWQRFWDYDREASSQYNHNLDLWNKLSFAAAAWYKKEFARFVSILEEIEPEAVPPAFKKRLQLAKQRLS